MQSYRGAQKAQKAQKVEEGGGHWRPVFDWSVFLLGDIQDRDGSYFAISLPHPDVP